MLGRRSFLWDAGEPVSGVMHFALLQRDTSLCCDVTERQRSDAPWTTRSIDSAAEMLIIAVTLEEPPIGRLNLSKASATFVVLNVVEAIVTAGQTIAHLKQPHETYRCADRFVPRYNGRDLAS